MHTEAPSEEATDWPQICPRSTASWLAESPSPVVELNHGATITMADGATVGLAAVEAAGADGSLDDYRLFHSARADLLRRLDHHDEAAAAYRRTLELSGTDAARAFLTARLDTLGEYRPAP